MARKKKNESCSDFEEMLMWTSYRYCIGRHTYVVSMAHDIARHYYNKLSDERKKFTANDIRQEIKDHLRFLPFEFNISRWYGSDEYNPLKVLFTFFEKENIESLEDLAKISRIEYDVNKDEYTFNRCESNFKTYISKMDIEDLIPWETLASCFDIKNHKMLVLKDGTEVEAFKTWTGKTIPAETRIENGVEVQYVKYSDFGWEEVWKPVDSYVNGSEYVYIPKENIKEIKDIE